MPQLFKKTYRMGTTWFYRFACMIVVQAHISLMTRLCGIVWQPSIFKGFTSILESLQIPIAACLRFRSETSFKIPDIWHCYICCICYDWTIDYSMLKVLIWTIYYSMLKVLIGISDNQQLSVQFLVSIHEMIHIAWNLRNLVAWFLDIITNHSFPFKFSIWSTRSFFFIPLMTS